jgi:hypothetical protein
MFFTTLNEVDDLIAQRIKMIKFTLPDNESRITILTEPVDPLFLFFFFAWLTCSLRMPVVSKQLYDLLLPITTEEVWTIPIARACWEGSSVGHPEDGFLAPPHGVRCLPCCLTVLFSGEMGIEADACTVSEAPVCLLLVEVVYFQVLPSISILRS